MRTSMLYEEHSPEIYTHQQAGVFVCHTLTALGFKRSAQAEAAGYRLIRPATQTRQRTSPAYWISAADWPAFIQCCDEIKAQRRTPRPVATGELMEPRNETAIAMERWCQQLNPSARCIVRATGKHEVHVECTLPYDFILPELCSYNGVLKWSLTVPQDPAQRDYYLTQQQQCYAQRISEWSLLLQAAEYWEPISAGVAALLRAVFEESRSQPLTAAFHAESLGLQALKKIGWGSPSCASGDFRLEWHADDQMLYGACEVPGCASITKIHLWPHIFQLLLSPDWSRPAEQHWLDWMDKELARKRHAVTLQWRTVMANVRPQISPRISDAELHDFFVQRMPSSYHEHRISRLLSDVACEAVPYFQSLLSVDELVSKFGVDWVVSRYRQARAIHRTITIFAGPTNSGKTYHAFEHARFATSVLFLAPLRLLAMEGYERLLAAYNEACLLTGEERIGDLQSRFVAATVEMCDPSRLVDVAIVDEAQMLADPDRGSAWTAALLGVAAKQVFLTCPMESVAMLTALFALTGEPVEVVHLERKSVLQIAPAPTSFAQIMPGTAVVAFSRRKLLSYKEAFEGKGLRCALIYGALSPEVRRGQAAMFVDGKADVLLSTDAISMGLNLPVQHVVLAEHEKFNGVDIESVAPGLIRQIAGRAGRFGIVEQGVVSGLNTATHDALRQAFSRIEPVVIDKYPVALDQMMVQLLSCALCSVSLAQIAERFIEVVSSSTSEFVGTVQGMQWLMFRELDLPVYSTSLSLSERFAAACAPVNNDNYEVWRQWCQQLSRRSVVTLPDARQVAADDTELRTLNEQEIWVNQLNLYRWMHYQFPDFFPHIEEAGQRLQQADAIITRLLRQSLKKRCYGCGCELPANWQHGRCDPCFAQAR